MRRTSNTQHRSGCPIGIALDVLGDPWTLLVVRDLMFKGRRTYREFLDGGEGIATNVLADRLARLEAHDIVAKHPDPDDGRRQIYRLTPKGVDLAPVMIELVLWSARHHRTAAPPAEIAAMTHQRERVLARVQGEWRASAPAPRARSSAARKPAPRRRRTP